MRNCYRQENKKNQLGLSGLGILLILTVIAIGFGFLLNPPDTKQAKTQQTASKTKAQKAVELLKEAGEAHENKKKKEDPSHPEVVDGDYPVKWIEYGIPSSIAMHGLDPRDVHWIDNQRVLFRGRQLNSSLEINAYIWDTQNNNVTLQGKGVSFICFNPDTQIVHYWEKGEDGERVCVYGELGKEKRGGECAGQQKHIYSWQTCQLYEKRVLQQYHATERLRPGHGWLDYGLAEGVLKDKLPELKGAPSLLEGQQGKAPRTAGSAREAFYQQQVKLHKPDGTVIPLVKPDGSPLTGMDVGRGREVNYSKFNNKYLIYGAVGQFWNYEETLWKTTWGKKGTPVANPYPVYVLSPEDGAIEERFLPPGPWMPPDDLVLTRKGVLRYSKLFSENGGVKRLFKYQKFTTISDKTTYANVFLPAVSPDGCKVINPGGRQGLALTNLCTETGEQSHD